ncbi:MAG: hypothetical protein H6581_16310 [Bacteroidia bacterium]|nr:hypothetical protein [Bacteroidia bacterium]
MTKKTLQHFSEMPLTGLRYRMADKLLGMDRALAFKPFAPEKMEEIHGALENGGATPPQMEAFQEKASHLLSLIERKQPIADEVQELISAVELIRTKAGFDEEIARLAGKTMAEWEAAVFPLNQWERFLHDLNQISNDEKLPEEFDKVKEALATGFAPQAPNLSTPERQLLWGGAFLYLMYNPSLQQIWPKQRRSRNMIQNPLWKQVLGAHHVRFLRALFGSHIFNLLKSNELLIGWGPPGSWFAYYPGRPGQINCDLLYSMLTGFDHARACAIHEIAHAVQTKGFPESVQKVHQELVVLEGKEALSGGRLAPKEHKRKDYLKQLHKLKSHFFNAAEDNCVNRFTEQIGSIFGQNYGYSLNYFYTAMGDVGRRFTSEEDPYPEDSPSARFNNLAYILSRVFLANNGLFTNSPEGWRLVKARPEWINGRNRANPEEHLSAEASFQQLMEMCAEVEHKFPPLQQLAGGPEHYAEMATESATERFALIEEIWDLYAQDLVDQMLDEEEFPDEEEIEEALDRFQMEINKPPEQPKQEDDKDEDEEKDEKEDKNPNPPDQSSKDSEDHSSKKDMPEQPNQEKPEAAEETPENEDDADNESGTDAVDGGEDGKEEEVEMEQKSSENPDEGEGEESEGESEQAEPGEEGEPEEAGAEGEEDDSEAGEEGEDGDEGEDGQSEEDGTEDGGEDAGDAQQDAGGEGEEVEVGADTEGEGDKVNAQPEFKPDPNKDKNAAKVEEQPDNDPTQPKDNEDVEMVLEEDEEKAVAELSEPEKSPEHEVPEDQERQDDGNMDQGVGGDDAGGVLDRTYLPDEALASIADLMDALREASEEPEEEEDDRIRDDGSEVKEQQAAPKFTIPQALSLDELANGSWENFATRVSMHGPIIGLMAQALGKLKDAQLKFIHKISKKHSLTPEGGDLRRYDHAAAQRLIDQFSKQEKFDKDDLNLFRKDHRIPAPTRPTRIILIDGSRSMSMGSSPLPIDKAMQEAVIDYMASKMAGYDTYISMFGPKNPLIIAKPGDNPVEIGKRIEKVHGGLNTMTFLSPALMQIIQLVAYRKKFEEAFVGFTNFVVYTDGDIDDLPHTRAIIQQVIEYVPKSTFDFVLVTNKRGTPMDILIRTLEIKNPIHEIGVTRGDANRKFPMSLTSTYKLANRLRRAAVTGIADPAFTRTGQFRRLLHHLVVPDLDRGF